MGLSPAEPPSVTGLLRGQQQGREVKEETEGKGGSYGRREPGGPRFPVLVVG